MKPQRGWQGRISEARIASRTTDEANAQALAQCRCRTIGFSKNVPITAPLSKTHSPIFAIIASL